MSEPRIPFSGGCACGTIRYESTAEPLLMLHCHCRDCQRSSGGPFSSFVIVPKDTFELRQGSLHFHDSPSERGGKTHRGFCPDCGSPIAVRNDFNPDICRDQDCEPGRSELVQSADECLDIGRSPVGSDESGVTEV
jgi:hypothetical protein